MSKTFDWEGFVLSFPEMILGNLFRVFVLGIVLCLIFGDAILEDSALATKRYDIYQHFRQEFGGEAVDKIWLLLGWKKCKETN